MTITTKASEVLLDETLDAVTGGAAYIKFDGVDGECKDRSTEHAPIVATREVQAGANPMDLKRG